MQGGSGNVGGWRGVFASAECWKLVGRVVGVAGAVRGWGVLGERGKGRGN